MRLGVEILAAVTTPLHLGNFFETWLATASGLVWRSLGRDEFHLDLTIDPGQRLAATGRTCLCQADLQEIGLGSNQARPAVLAPTHRLAGEALYLGLRTNVFLGREALQAGSHLRVITGVHVTLWHPAHPDLALSEVAPGRFIVELTAVLDGPTRTP